MDFKMSTFIELLRQYNQALETQYSSQLSPDMRKAIFAMLSCKTGQQGKSLWACSSCEHHDSQHFLVGIDIAHNANKAQPQRGLKDKNKKAYLLNISRQHLPCPIS